MCVAAAIAGAAVVGAGASAYSANKAAGAQKDAANQASNTQMGMFNQIQANEQPYLSAGQGALSQLQSIYGLGGKGPNAGQIMKTLQGLPGYQFQMQQGTQAVDRSAAARGLLNSGATGKALTQYGQGLASNYLGNYVNGLAGIAGMGQASAGQQAQVGMNTANQIGANQMSAGNAAAAGYIGTGQAINGAINNGIGLYGMYQGGYGGGGMGGGSAYGAPPSYIGTNTYSTASNTVDAYGNAGGWG
jgi:hypothetical protein